MRTDAGTRGGHDRERSVRTPAGGPADRSLGDQLDSGSSADGGVTENGETIRTTVPGQLDRLPWAHWHWVVLLGLGTVWILDGLEVTIVGAVGSTLTSKGSGISITTAQVGDAAGIYIAGACAGALLFGYLTDRYGRKRLFLVTLGLYLVATILTATSTDAWMFFAFRFLTGMGIGGEYAAINSAIDELIPARARGTVDLMVNGSYWLGTAVGAAATLVLLDPNLLATDVGWRICFFMGAVLGLAILLVRRNLPESPRWLFTHGRPKEAEEVVADIEHQVRASTGIDDLGDPGEPLVVHPRSSVGFVTVAKTVFGHYPRRATLGLALFVGQAFLYNAIFFTYSLVLSTFYHVPASSTGYYLIAFAAGNFLGPLVLGRLFDIVGRRVMISACYLLSGVMLAVSAWLFDAGVLTATTQTVAWVVIFFFASAGASSAYLTVSEIFPMETRALAIAFFYAVGTGLGGIIGPVLFGSLVATGVAGNMAVGYLIGAGLMVGAGVVEVFLGVDAEQRSLEELATPLSAEAAPDRPDTRGEAGVRGGGTVTAVRHAPAHLGSQLQARVHRPPTTTRRAWAPAQAVGAARSDEAGLALGVERLVQVLAADGPLPRTELASRVRARTWGPGAFGRSLRAAEGAGRIRRVGRHGHEVYERVPSPS